MTFALVLSAVAVLALTIIIIRISLAFAEALDDIREGMGSIHLSIGNALEAIDVIRSSLEDGLVLEDAQLFMLHSYHATLYFDGGVEVTGVMGFGSDVGYDDEIELFPDTEDDDGLSLVFDHDCFVCHARTGPQLHIPVNCSIAPFRDRLMSDGWEITSPESGGTDDAVLPDKTEAICQGQ